jgi:hypothetical protein
MSRRTAPRIAVSEAMPRVEEHFPSRASGQLRKESSHENA